jgi:hypothetical protein
VITGHEVVGVLHERGPEPAIGGADQRAIGAIDPGTYTPDELAAKLQKNLAGNPDWTGYFLRAFRRCTVG